MPNTPPCDSEKPEIELSIMRTGSSSRKMTFDWRNRGLRGGAGRRPEGRRAVWSSRSTPAEFDGREGSRRVVVHPKPLVAGDATRARADRPAACADSRVARAGRRPRLKVSRVLFQRRRNRTPPRSKRTGSRKRARLLCPLAIQPRCLHPSGLNATDALDTGDFHVAQLCIHRAMLGAVTDAAIGRTCRKNEQSISN